MLRILLFIVNSTDGEFFDFHLVSFHPSPLPPVLISYDRLSFHLSRIARRSDALKSEQIRLECNEAVTVGGGLKRDELRSKEKFQRRVLPSRRLISKENRRASIGENESKVPRNVEPTSRCLLKVSRGHSSLSVSRTVPALDSIEA